MRINIIWTHPMVDHFRYEAL